jgi:hypothetical protein
MGAAAARALSAATDLFFEGVIKGLVVGLGGSYLLGLVGDLSFWRNKSLSLPTLTGEGVFGGLG